MERLLAHDVKSVKRVRSPTLTFSESAGSAATSARVLARTGAISESSLARRPPRRMRDQSARLLQNRARHRVATEQHCTLWGSGADGKPVATDRGARAEGRELVGRGSGEGKERVRRGSGEGQERARRGSGEVQERVRRESGEGEERVRRGQERARQVAELVQCR